MFKSYLLGGQVALVADDYARHLAVVLASFAYLVPQVAHLKHIA